MDSEPNHRGKGQTFLRVRCLHHTACRGLGDDEGDWEPSVRTGHSYTTSVDTVTSGTDPTMYLNKDHFPISVSARVPIPHLC